MAFGAAIKKKSLVPPSYINIKGNLFIEYSPYFPFHPESTR